MAKTTLLADSHIEIQQLQMHHLPPQPQIQQILQHLSVVGSPGYLEIVIQQKLSLPLVQMAQM
jgi:hypothetical protein